MFGASVASGWLVGQGHKWCRIGSGGSLLVWECGGGGGGVSAGSVGIRQESKRA